MIQKFFSYVVIVFVATFFNGCGITFLNVQSNPSGAEVKLLKSGQTALTDSQVQIPASFFEPNRKAGASIDTAVNSIGVSKDDVNRLSGNFKSNFMSHSEALYFKKEGFRSKFAFVNLEKGAQHSITETLSPIDTKITINSDPIGAFVTLNLPREMLPVGWEQAFKTPMTFEATKEEAQNLLKQGLAIQNVELDGYFALQKQEKELIKPGEVTTLTIPLRPIITTVKIMTEPEGAAVEDLTEGGFGYLGETPVVKNFNWEDVMVWAKRADVARVKNGTFDAIDLNLRITKSGHQDIYMQNLKVPVGEERVFKRELKELTKTIKFSCDPEGTHVYVVRNKKQNYYDETSNQMSTKDVEYLKHLGSTPFNYNVSQSEPIKHGDFLIFKQSGYMPQEITFVEGEANYHVVLEPAVIKAR